MRDIQKEILENLDRIEEQYQVKILHAVESGSRAWGFASPDSDYDVRFIYMHRPEEYLRIDPAKDVIEWQLNEVLDINDEPAEITEAVEFNGLSVVPEPVDEESVEVVGDIDAPADAE